MSGSNPEWPGDFQSLAQQYWNAWGDFARQSGTAGQPGPLPSQGWQQAIDWWSKLAHGGREEANTALEQFNHQMRHGFGLMQDLAGRFAGQPASAGDIAQAWRQALGANGGNPFPELFKAMRGQGLQDLGQWVEDASPWLSSMREQLTQGLRQPAVGLAREHQERWQKLAQAQIEHQEQMSRYQALLAKAGENAFSYFEAKLAERSEPGRQIDSARALFDLWIDAAEEAYAEVALSDEFRTVYGALVNAQMRLRAAIQTEVESAARSLGMPTRSEVQATHAKVHALERELRRLRARVAGLEKGEPAAASAGKKTAVRKSAAPAGTRPGKARSGAARSKAAPARRGS